MGDAVLADGAQGVHVGDEVVLEARAGAGQAADVDGYADRKEEEEGDRKSVV